MKLVDKAYVFDNSSQDMHLFTQIKNGELEIVSDFIPNWFITELSKM
ncbi:hypothetical protein [Paenimyroides tangerinum]|nr:hypothetical protein [Paenimyroides tangerinum]